MGFEGVWLFVSIEGNRDELWLSLTFDTVPGGHDVGRRSLIRRDGLSGWKDSQRKRNSSLFSSGFNFPSQKNSFPTNSHRFLVARQQIPIWDEAIG